MQSSMRKASFLANFVARIDTKNGTATNCILLQNCEENGRISPALQSQTEGISRSATPERPDRLHDPSLAREEEPHPASSLVIKNCVIPTVYVNPSKWIAGCANRPTLVDLVMEIWSLRYCRRGSHDLPCWFASSSEPC